MLLANHVWGKQLFVLIAMSVIMYIYFMTDLFRGIIIAVIFQGMLFGIDYLALIALDYIWADKTEKFLSSVAASSIAALICKMVLFGLVLIIRKRWNQNEFMHMHLGRQIKLQHTTK